MVWDTKAATNWFLTWDEDSAADGKSFLLQVELTNLIHRDLLSDSINSYVTICRQRNGPSSGWELIGKTALIKDDPNPAYPQGFRVFYEQCTDLSHDLLKVICYHRRDTLAHEDIIGTACISVRELVRAFGTRVQVELLKGKTDKIVGAVWFLGEALPNQSPRGANNSFEFCISAMPPRRADLKFPVVPKLFLVVSRERDDQTWAVVYRTDVVRGQTMAGLLNKHMRIVFKPFALKQSELVLGKTPMRRVRFDLFQKGKHGESHVCVGSVYTCVDELLNEFLEDTSLDLLVDGGTVGEFASVSKSCEKHHMRLQIEINYFNLQADLREMEERRMKRSLNLDSP